MECGGSFYFYVIVRFIFCCRSRLGSFYISSLAQLRLSVRIIVRDFDTILYGIRPNSLLVLLVWPRSLACMIGFLHVIALLIKQIHTRTLHPEPRQQVFGAVVGEWMSKV